jgi:hypothetical protein
MIGHDQQAEQASQPVRKAEQVLDAAIGQPQVFPEEQSGKQAGRVVGEAGVPLSRGGTTRRATAIASRAKRRSSLSMMARIWVSRFHSADLSTEQVLQLRFPEWPA